MPISGKFMKRDIIHSFFIPRRVQGKLYWFKRGIYIYRRFERRYYGLYPDRWFSDGWYNICLTTKSIYKAYKKTGKLPKSNKYK